MSRFTKIDYSYHNHTYRCGHASGKDEDYIQQAIAAGIKVYGISDHVFLKNIEQPYMRGSYAFFLDYFASIKNLKEKYCHQIDIYSAFEAEYLSDYLDYYKDLLVSKTVDYLIIGQHGFIQDGEFVFYANLQVSPYEKLKRYLDDLISGMNTGLFRIVAHPDLFFSYYPRFDDIALEATRKIIQAAKDNHMILEINLGGIRQGKNIHFGEYRYRYPVREFWIEVAKSKVPVMIGIDAHNPENFHSSGLLALEELIGDLPLNYVNRISFGNDEAQVVIDEKK
ncbi:MAG: histidinol-phosphatase [Bacilli bacterium]|jgi:histidinol-phosphatase (PHP family)